MTGSWWRSSADWNGGRRGLARTRLITHRAGTTIWSMLSLALRAFLATRAGIGVTIWLGFPMGRRLSRVRRFSVTRTLEGCHGCPGEAQARQGATIGVRRLENSGGIVLWEINFASVVTGRFTKTRTA